MSTRIITLPAARRPAVRALAGTARGWLGRFARWFIEADRRYRERRYLEEMSDELLRDIGLTRDDLRRAMRDRGTMDRH